MHRLEELIGNIGTAVVAGFRHVAEKFHAFARIVLEQGVLASLVQIPGQQHTRPTKVHAQQQAHAIGVLAIATTESAQGRFPTQIELDRTEDSYRRLAAAVRFETWEVDIGVADSLDRSWGPRFCPGPDDRFDEVMPLTV